MSRGYGGRAECRPVAELLSAYLDGEVDAGERTRVEAHLEVCEACRAELESLRATAGMLHRLPLEPAPRSFLIPAPEPQTSWVMRLMRPMKLATAAAVFVLALVVGADFVGNQALMSGDGVATYQTSAPADQLAGQATLTPSPEATSGIGREAATPQETPQAATSAPVAGEEKAQAGEQAAAPLAAMPTATEVTSESGATPATGGTAAASSSPSTATGGSEQTQPAVQPGPENNAREAQPDSSLEEVSPSPAATGGAQTAPSEGAGTAARVQTTNPAEPAAAATLPGRSTTGIEIWFRVSEAVLVLIVIALLGFLLIARRLGGIQERG